LSCIVRPTVRASSRRGRLGRQGGEGANSTQADKARQAKGGTAGGVYKSRRSRVASLKLRPESAASPASRATFPTLAICSGSATRSLP